MRSSHRFLDIAKDGENSTAKWTKTELFTFLWTIPGSIVTIGIGILFGNRGRNLLESIQPPALGLLAMLLPFVSALYGLARQVRLQHKRHWLTILTPNAHINWSKIGIGAAVWGVILVIDLGVNYGLEPQRFSWSFQPMQWLLLLIVAVAFIPLQAAFEELAFRGYFMQTSALVARRVWQPLLITSISFGAMHFTNPEVKAYGWVMMIGYCGTGLILGIATLMDDSAELAVGAHAANNVLSVLLVTEANSVFQTPSLFRVAGEQPSAWWLFLDTAVPGAIFLLIVAKVYAWGSWRRLIAPIWDLPNHDESKISHATVPPAALKQEFT